MPLVSVIVPVYNMEKYLAETLDSVLQSAYRPFEIVIMDDGSTDRSYQIAEEYAQRHPNIHCYIQKNAGVSKARNNAISKTSGKYILPVDSDDLISPTLIGDAVEVLENNSEVKVVVPSAEFFGDRKGAWRLPAFSIHTLARKNMIPISAMYAKSDWVRVGGYCETIIAREDWDFWISVLKNGGEVVRLPKVGLYYRVQAQSKRIRDRKLKHHVIDVLNQRHADFFLRELNGPLHYQRTWSKVFNAVNSLFCSNKMRVNPEYANMTEFVLALPNRFDKEGTSIYKGRNELKQFCVDGTDVVVKSYQRPILINRFVYGLFRASKAERSYEYALRFLKAGIGTPAPVGYFTQRRNLLLERSFFVSLKSHCDFQYTDFAKKKFVHKREILEAIGRTTARMHENGFLHKDYSAGNILFRDELPVPVEIIDLNRMRFGSIDLPTGCKNFERLPGDEEMFAVMGKAYADARMYDVNKCVSLINKFHE